MKFRYEKNYAVGLVKFMRLHQLKASQNKKKKRIGRGGKRGTFSGRGVKGQKSRAGAKIRPEIRDFIKRFHKLRGYNFSGKHIDKPVILSFSKLEKVFKNNEKITIKQLAQKGLINKISGKYPRVKILKGKTAPKIKLNFADNIYLSKNINK